MKKINLKISKLILYVGFLFAATPFVAQAQTSSIHPIQGLSFGALILGSSGGSVTVSSSGIRSSTGGITLANLGVSHSPATMEIEAPQGTTVLISSAGNIQLPCSNGTATLTLGTPDKGSSFVTTLPGTQRTTVNIGGTLTVGGQQTNTNGNCTGMFTISVTFIEQ